MSLLQCLGFVELWICCSIDCVFKYCLNAYLTGLARMCKTDNIVIPCLGVDVDCRDTTGCTALFWTCLEGKQGLVPVLLKHGADPNA